MKFHQVSVVSSPEAADLLAGPAHVMPVDSTWYMPNSPYEAKDQFYNEDRILGSVFFDLDQVCDSESSFPHMLPTQSVFNDAVAKLGIRDSDSVLIYDRSGVFSGPRAAWTFALYGHKKVYLLDHYEEFKSKFDVDFRKLAPSLDQKSSLPYHGASIEDFSSSYKSQVIEFEELLDLVKSQKLTQQYILFDARSKGRFTGEDPEPRKGLSSGHVPGSLSLPFSKVLNDDGHYKSRDELLGLFKQEFSIDIEAPLQKGIIVMCGTGVSAVILMLALNRILVEPRIRVYDGSWTEWAQRAPELIEKNGV